MSAVPPHAGNENRLTAQTEEMTGMVWARSIAVAGATAAVVLLAAPTWADVTVTETTGGKMFGQADLSGTKVTRIKGHKMRQDTTRATGDSVSMIFDVDGGKMIILNNTKKEATVRSTADFAEAASKITDADVKSDFTATTATKTVAGQSCMVYDGTVAVTFAMMEKQPPMTMTMKGPICLSKNAPGVADYRGFYEAAAQKGFFFTDPTSAKAQPGMAKAVATMLKKMADAGMPLSADLTMSFEGEGMMAQMMQKMGTGKMTNEATKIETSSIGDDVFEVPAGYKTKEMK
jgi:hypothetical protein